jgi:hypothetical protein
VNKSKSLTQVPILVGVLTILLVGLSSRPGQAVASKLVQIVNTAASPVPTLDNSRNPANIVTLLATLPAGRAGTFALQSAEGTRTPFTSVPSGKTLVLESGHFLMEHGAPAVNVQFGILQADGSVSSVGVWVLSGFTTVLSWPPGIVIGPGQTPSIGAFGDDMVIWFRGYLVAQ